VKGLAALSLVKRVRLRPSQAPSHTSELARRSTRPVNTSTSLEPAQNMQWKVRIRPDGRSFDAPSGAKQLICHI
jgi:hypothetical protein